MADTLLAGDAPAAGTEPAGTTPAAGTAPAAAAATGAGATPTAGTEPAAPAAPVVPESYEFAMPEGVTLDAALVGEFTPLAKELKLTQEQAQKVVDLHAKAIAAVHERAQEAMQQTVAGWLDAAKADPEIGGAKLTETVTVAKKALDRFGSPALVEVLESTGLGNHPELVRFAAKIGKAISEDALVVGAAPAGAPKTLGQALYPNLPSNPNGAL